MTTRRRRADYGRIVNARHFERLTALVDPARVVTGGRSDASTRYLEPTLVEVDDADDPRELVMREEIFGPVLPLVAVDGLDAAIDVVNRRDKPLALYVFTRSDEVRQRFVRDTSSGALGFNIPLAHLAVPGLPFGGVGPSGMGAYHGERSVAALLARQGRARACPPGPTPRSGCGRPSPRSRSRSSPASPSPAAGDAGTARCDHGTNDSGVINTGVAGGHVDLSRVAWDFWETSDRVARLS